MADYGASDTSTTTLGANQTPISEVYPPSGSLTSAAGGQLTATEGGPASTDATSKRSAPASIWIRDGNNITQGAQADAAATTDAGTFSLIALFKRLLQGITTLTGKWSAATGTKANVVAAITSTTILASNANRKGAIIYNDSTAILYLDLSGGTASATSYSVQIPANGYFEVPGPAIYTGLVTGIWVAANGNARVTEFS